MDSLLDNWLHGLIDDNGYEDQMRPSTAGAGTESDVYDCLVLCLSFSLYCSMKGVVLLHYLTAFLCTIYRSHFMSLFWCFMWSICHMRYACSRFSSWSGLWVQSVPVIHASFHRQLMFLLIAAAVEPKWLDYSVEHVPLPVKWTLEDACDLQS